MTLNKLLIVQKSKLFNAIAYKDATSCLNLIHVIENTADTSYMYSLSFKFYV